MPPATHPSIGIKYGNLLVVAVASKRSRNRHPMVLCTCDCGKEVTKNLNDLKSGGTRSCGCLKVKLPEMTGLTKLQRRREYSRRWKSSNKQQVLDAGLMERHGLTRRQWEEIIARQNNVCACCSATAPGRTSGWCVDHNHSTGVIRGIICYKCNILLGQLGDDADGVAAGCSRLLSYLEMSGDKPNPASWSHQGRKPPDFCPLRTNPIKVTL